MKTKLKCTNPSEILYTITITATAQEFDDMRDNNKLPYVLSRDISDLLCQANRTFEN